MVQAQDGYQMAEVKLAVGIDGRMLNIHENRQPAKFFDSFLE